MLAVSHEHRKQHDLSLHRWQRITQRKTKRAMCLCHGGKLSEGMMRDEQTARPGRLLLCIAHHLLQRFLIQPKRRDLAQSAQRVLCLRIQLTALDERQLNMNGEQAARRLDERGQLIQAEHLRTARDDPSAGKAETTHMIRAAALKRLPQMSERTRRIRAMEHEHLYFSLPEHVSKQGELLLFHPAQQSADRTIPLTHGFMQKSKQSQARAMTRIDRCLRIRQHLPAQRDGMRMRGQRQRIRLRICLTHGSKRCVRALCGAAAEDALFPGILHDLRIERSVSPWNEDAQIDALPVYVNPDPFTDDDYGLQDTDRNKMKQMLSAAAERLGLDPDELRFYEDADSGCLYVGSEGVELQVDQALTLTITFEPGITLPDDLHFTYTASYAECLKVSEYLKERYAGVIGMQDPQSAIIGGDRDIDGVQRYAITIYEKGETAAEDLLNQQFRSAVFSCDDEGRLWIIRIHDPDLSQQCGEYPIISMQEAESLLKAGTYLSNVPYAISEEDVIAKGELVYRHDQFDRYFMPYYRFLVDIGEDKGMRCYGAFYVPAVSSEYIETMPHEGDIPQTAG